MPATEQYIADFFSMVSAPSESTMMNGALQSPANPHCDLFIMEGAKTIITNASTNRIEVLLDPEATLRNGQPKLYAYEYNNAGNIVAMTDVDVSAGSSNFSCASVIAARLDVQNSSSHMEVSGSMTGAVLNTVPKDVHALTQTSLKQKCRRKSDQTMCLMKDNGITLHGITSHLGTKHATMETGVTANRESWLKTYNKALVTAIDPTSGFTASGVSFAGAAANADITVATTIAQLAPTNADRLWDTNFLTEKPFTQGTFGAVLDIKAELAMTANDSDQFDGEFMCVLLDQEGKLLSNASQTVTMTNAISANDVLSIDLHFEFPKQARPIARAYVYLKNSTTTAVQLAAHANTPVLSATLRGLECTSDIPDRDMFIVVAEGVNSEAAITVQVGLVVSGIPSADQTFISGGSAYDGANYAKIMSYLHAVLLQMGRASLHNEVEDLRSVITHLMKTPQHMEALHAFSFSDIGKLFGRVAGAVRSGVRGFDNVLKHALPVLGTIGKVARGISSAPIIGGFAREVADVADTAGRFGSEIHRYTQHADSHDRMNRLYAMSDY
uniref:Uncharacterized protein n=1 Tax=viral metagenome TaxID=1070528 RepID=A0A2V0RM17_9ZZZZ